MIRIEFIFSHFKSIPLGASGERFRKQTKEGKSLFTLRGLVSCDANKTSSELPLGVYLYFSWLHFGNFHQTIQFCIKDNSVWKRFRKKRFFWEEISCKETFIINFWTFFTSRPILFFFSRKYFLRRDFMDKEIFIINFWTFSLQVDQGVIWKTMMDWESLAAVAEKVDEGQIPTTKQTVYVRQRSSIAFYQAKQDWKLIALHDFAKKRNYVN